MCQLPMSLARRAVYIWLSYREVSTTSRSNEKCFLFFSGGALGRVIDPHIVGLALKYASEIDLSSSSNLN